MYLKPLESHLEVKWILVSLFCYVRYNQTNRGKRHNLSSLCQDANQALFFLFFFFLLCVLDVSSLIVIICTYLPPSNNSAKKNHFTSSIRSVQIPSLFLLLTPLEKNSSCCNLHINEGSHAALPLRRNFQCRSIYVCQSDNNISRAAPLINVNMLDSMAFKMIKGFYKAAKLFGDRNNVLISWYYV